MVLIARLHLLLNTNPNKFKLKSGDKPQISKFIDNEVTRYLKNDRLTEDTLRNLDGKISKEAGLRDRKE